MKFLMNYILCMEENQEVKINQKQIKIYNKKPNPNLIVKKNRMQK